MIKRLCADLEIFTCAQRTLYTTSLPCQPTNCNLTSTNKTQSTCVVSNERRWRKKRRWKNKHFLNRSLLSFNLPFRIFIIHKHGHHYLCIANVTVAKTGPFSIILCVRTVSEIHLDLCIGICLTITNHFCTNHVLKTWNKLYNKHFTVLAAEAYSYGIGFSQTLSICAVAKPKTHLE